MVSAASNEGQATPPAQALLWHGERNFGMVKVQGSSDEGIFIYDQMGIPVGGEVVLMFPTPGGKSVDLRGVVLHGVTAEESQRTMRASGTIVELRNVKKSTREPEPAAPIVDEGPTPVILIVDDDRVLGKLLETWIGGLGYDTRNAINGKQAVQIMEDDEVQVVLAIVDSLLPDTSGDKLIRKIVEMSSETKIISTSGVFTRSDSKSQVFSAGATTFLAKPLEQDTVLRTVQHVLNGGNRMTASRVASLAAVG